jgi:hypothetical protein
VSEVPWLDAAAWRRRRVGSVLSPRSLPNASNPAANADRFSSAIQWELPDPRIGAQTIKHSGARKRRVHHREVRNLFRVGARVSVGNHQSDVVPDDGDRTDELQVLAEQAMDIVCHGMAFRRPGGNGAG